MTRYFFHTHDRRCDIDEVGVDFPDDAAAGLEAVRYGGSLIADDPHLLGNGNGLRVECVDEEGRLRFTLLVNAVDSTGNLARSGGGDE